MIICDLFKKNDLMEEHILFSKWGKMGCLKFCIEEMYLAFLYFNYSTMTSEKPYNNHTN
jgi:hypothetical protein